MCPGQPLAVSLEPGQAARVEGEARETLAQIPDRIWDGHSLPVPIERIAREVFGLRVLMKSDREMKEAIGLPGDDEGWISGLLFSQIGEIWVNSWEAEQPWGTRRTRFTIGHELGHHILHQTGLPGIYCRADPEENQGNDLALDPVPRTIPEVEANTFSAAILMPETLARKQLSGIPEEDVELLFSNFVVSRKASERRIHTLRLLAGI